MICRVHLLYGCRKSSPSTLYYPTTNFNASIDNDWSVVIQFIDTPVLGGTMRADVSFLSDNAPYEKLVSGFLFSVFEGHKLTGDVEIE